MGILRLGHIRTAQLRVKKLNDELASQGYWIEKGRVPVNFFHEKYPIVDEEPTIPEDTLRGGSPETLKAILRDTVISIMEEEKKKLS